MTGRTLLHPGDPFPALTVALPGGRALRLPDVMAGQFGVVLFYNGTWCPYCNVHLAAFQRWLEVLASLNVPIVALPAGDEAITPEVVARHGLRPPPPGPTTGQCLLPSMTTASTIPPTSPGADGGRRPCPACRNIRCPSCRAAAGTQLSRQEVPHGTNTT